MELEKFSVSELTAAEQLQINGGGTLGDFFGKVWDGIVEAAEWIWEHLTLSFEITAGPVKIKGQLSD